MKAVMQTKFGQEEGNCFQACIASILEMPLEEVPNFCSMGAGWWFHFETWLRARGLAAINLSQPLYLSGGFYYIASGTSPRGLSHATVWQDCKLVHDPHPDGGGIDTVSQVDILVPLDYAKFAILNAVPDLMKRVEELEKENGELKAEIECANQAAEPLIINWAKFKEVNDRLKALKAEQENKEHPNG